MTPLDVDLLAERAPRTWPGSCHGVRIVAWVWGGLCVVTTFVLAAQGWMAHRELQRLRAGVAWGAAAVVPGPAVSAAAATAATAAPYEAEAAALASIAAFDIGSVLADVEAVREPGVRLRRVSVNASEGTATALFELADLSRMQGVLASLNREEARPHWTAIEVTGPREGAAGTLLVRGKWRSYAQR